MGGVVATKLRQVEKRLDEFIGDPTGLSMINSNPTLPPCGTGRYVLVVATGVPAGLASIIVAG